MHVGMLQVPLHVPDSQSLKDKRRIVRGLLDRIRAKFEVAAAEIEDQDMRQRSVVGFAAAGSSCFSTRATPTDTSLCARPSRPMWRSHARSGAPRSRC